MASNVNRSDSENVRFIVNQWIGGLKDKRKYSCLDSLILSKLDRNSTSFDGLLNDIDALVQSAEKESSKKLLKEFPAAFADENPTASDSENTESQSARADDRYETDGDDGPLVAPAHQSSVSQGSRGYGSPGYDSDDFVETERQPEKQQREFRIEQSEYQQHDANAQLNNGSRAVQSGRKRGNDDSGVTKNPAAKRTANANVSSNDVVVIDDDDDDDDDDDTGTPSTSKQNHNERRPATNDGNFGEDIAELEEVVERINVIDENISELSKEREGLLERKKKLEKKLSPNDYTMDYTRKK